MIIPDLYPILKFPEACGRLRKSARKRIPQRARSTPAVPSEQTSQSSNRSSQAAVAAQPVTISVDACLCPEPCPQPHDVPATSHDSPEVPEGGGVVSQSQTCGCVDKVVKIDQVDSEFERLTRLRSRLASVVASQSSVLGPGERTSRPQSPFLGTGEQPSRPLSPLVTAGMGVAVGEGAGGSSAGLQRAGSYDRKLRTSSDERYVCVCVCHVS